MTDIHELTVSEQALHVRKRELSPVEITRHYLSRIERLNDRLGAYVTVTEEDALAQARSAEQRVLRDTPEDLPPLCGIPVPIKDLDMVAGVRWTWGSAVYAEQVAPLDEDFVAELRAAGAVLIGKTNTPEFGMACHTDNDVAPPARSPWDLTRSAGGSSGGAGAAVAAGLAPVAQGSDGAGSIRIPASVCGLVGLKPTRGRVTAAPVRPDLIGLSTTGPLARTVTDAATLLDAVAITRPGDYFPAPALPSGVRFRDYAVGTADALAPGAVGEGPRRLRIGRFAESPVPDAPTQPEVRAAYDSVSHLLEELGHEVVDIEVPLAPEVQNHFGTVWAAMATRYPVQPEDEQRLRPLSRWLRERGRGLSATEYLDATHQLQLAIRAAMTRMDEYDAVLTPTLAQLPAEVGSFSADGDPVAEFERMTRFTPFTVLANLTGQPAISLPLVWNPGPIGTTLMGRFGGEPTLIALAAQLEQARPWHGRRPPIWNA
ncbi:amidase [Lipingzhangella sp. LS1_29]|uniref:Amidase n=1 Tax=Lipingzhangella rawalii TaxID=2055835 RepID=A0ABU2H714_9ACTN|nr:amidase [Lipingzhangella rawalii]MDS1271090.1 amidase [Lipingzhangella rawalii]